MKYFVNHFLSFLQKKPQSKQQQQQQKTKTNQLQYFSLDISIVIAAFSRCSCCNFNWSLYNYFLPLLSCCCMYHIHVYYIHPNMGRGMITRPIWKCPCIKLFITYFRHLEKRHPYWPETKSRPISIGHCTIIFCHCCLVAACIIFMFITYLVQIKAFLYDQYDRK
jgi:low temperature requirement protein LtrA